jgi:tetratricopeptide (TPR) repeat protein
VAELGSDLVALQRLRDSFNELRRGAPLASRSHEQSMLRLVGRRWAAARCRCAAASCASGDEGRARWAYALLGHIAGRGAARDRVIEALVVIANDTQAPDPAKVSALALLTELDAPLPSSTHIEDLHGVQERSLHQLAACLDGASDVARAADLLCDQLDGDELVEFVDSLTELEPRRSMPLLDELLLRDDLDERSRIGLRQVRAPLVDRRRARRVPEADGPAVSVRTGLHRSGRIMVIASQRLRGSQPPRWRGLSALVEADGSLLDGLYRDDYTRRGLDRDVVSELERQGFRFEEATAELARQILVDAARVTRRSGRRLPRAFFLGRDMVGIYDQHQILPRPSDLGPDLPALLSRAVELIGAGATSRARPLLERYVAAVPDDPEGCSQLGLCLLALGDVAGSRPHLERAAWLEPDNSGHHWNAAAAAHRDGHRGACYLALAEFLARLDEDDREAGLATGEPGYEVAIRRHTAEQFVAEYERLARLELPGTPAATVARADELYQRAGMRLRGGGVEEAVAALRQAVRLAPAYHQAWRALGAIHCDRGRFAEARRALERALALRPGDRATRKALAELATRQAQADGERRANGKRVRPARKPGARSARGAATRRGQR